MTNDIIHEIDRNTKTARATQIPCGKAAPGRPRNPRNGSYGKGIARLCSSLQGYLQKLMKVVLCFNRPFGVPGCQEDKHLFNIAGTEETNSRPFLPSAFRRNVIVWICTSLSRTAISGWTILRHLYRSFWNTFREALFWFSTAGRFAVGRKEDCAGDFPGVSISNGSRLMLLNLIRPSRSGITASTTPLPAIFLMIYLNLKKVYVSLSSIFVHKKCYYVRSSRKLDLKYESFH